MEPAAEYFHLDIGDARLAVSRKIIDPASPTMIFLHDSLGCIAFWRDFPEKLARTVSCNVLIYDRQGYGDSSPFASEPRGNDYMNKEATILMTLLEACNIDQPVLFGHSDGGTIALLAAAGYPGKIKAVITEGAHVFVEDITLDGIERAVEQYERTNLRARLEKYHGTKTDAVFKAWTATWLSSGYREWNIGSFLSEITCPVLAVQGTEDEYGSVAQVNAIATKVSGPAEICMIPNAGHTPHKQSELWLIDRCCTFMEQQGLLN